MLFLGPLAGPESQRAVNRTWVLALRTLAVVPPAMVLFIVFWWWWFEFQFDEHFQPRDGVATGLAIVIYMLITAGLAMSPALLAGSLAGEKSAGFLALLLGCQVSSGEIVRGRLAGRLTIVALAFLATLPVVAMLAGLRGLTWHSQAILLGVPVAVSFGGGGLALGASAISRRGRDALFAVYLLDLLFLLAPVFGGAWLPYAALEWLAPLNPYAVIEPLVNSENVSPALTTIGLWTTLGLLGAGWATWQLRPAYLRDTERAPRRVSRRAEIPPVGDRMMLWKELHIEQRRENNRFVRWFVALIVFLLVACSTLAATIAVVTFWYPQAISIPGEEIAGWIATTSLPLSWLIQWSLGLRAAVTVAAEREQATWDNLLITPLEGREIVWAKIWGSVYALRWLMAAVIFSWTVCAVCGLFAWPEYAERVLRTLIEGLFMVALGVWASLACQTATRAMTLTLFGWLMAAWVLMFAVGMASTLVLVGGYLLYATFEAALHGYDATSRATVGASNPFHWFHAVYVALSLLAYAFAAVLIGAHCHRNFNYLAGRAIQYAPRGTRQPRVESSVEAVVVS